VTLLVLSPAFAWPVGDCKLRSGTFRHWGKNYDTFAGDVKM
jgi:hypothetical protein